MLDCNFWMHSCKRLKKNFRIQIPFSCVWDLFCCCKRKQLIQTPKISKIIKWIGGEGRWNVQQICFFSQILSEMEKKWMFQNSWIARQRCSRRLWNVLSNTIDYQSKTSFDLGVKLASICSGHFSLNCSNENWSDLNETMESFIDLFVFICSDDHSQIVWMANPWKLNSLIRWMVLYSR